MVVAVVGLGPPGKRYIGGAGLDEQSPCRPKPGGTTVPSRGSSRGAQHILSFDPAMNLKMQRHADRLMKRRHPIGSPLRRWNCARLTPATSGINARPINCDLANARAGAADQRRLFLLWHQKWLHYLRQENG